jgi:photosystem II stability/assembly factor-like uncharacterized protein
MKKIFVFTIALLLSASIGLGQTWLNPEAATKDGMNFHELQKQFNEYFHDKMMEQDPFEGPEDEEWYQFKRWEWFTENRLLPNGDFPPPDILWNEFHSYKNSHREPGSMVSPPWYPVGPSVIPSSGGGLGRINCITFMPGNPNSILVGAACGGVWKTVDGGNTWSIQNSDLFASMSIADIAIDPADTNIIYIATGDNYGIYSAYSTTGHYTAGVLKSTDGGQTWNQTGMQYSQDQLKLLQRLIINPNNPNILLLASNSPSTGGIFRTTDAGATWTNVRTGIFYSIEFNPLNPNTVFASDGVGIWRSYDGGVTWTQNNLGYSNNRVTVKTTPADTNYVYVWGPTAGFKRSTNGGTTFTTMTSPNSYCTPYGYYDRVIAVSPTNPNEVYTGGLDVARTTNGGSTWVKVSSWQPPTAPDYCHADQKRMEFFPNGTAIFTVNDGGIFKSVNNGQSWTDLTSGMQISQFYRIASAATNPNIIYSGAQDNGSNRYDGTNWVRVYGADGMQPLVDYTNTNNVFVCSQSGGLRKSTNGGNTFTNVSPAAGPWVTPYIMDPNNPQIMYYGSSNGIYKSTNMGSTWVLSSTGATGSIRSLAIAKSNTNIIYAGRTTILYKSTNAGGNWTNITGTLPVGSANITYIAVSNTDPNKVWVTFSGYSAGNKVYMSTDGGVTWTNYSGTLPNIPATCIVYRDNSADELYIGTDFGVFFRDATATDWIAYNTSLPNVIIDHLEIHYGTNKLRAGTYGRGIWQLDLPVITGHSSQAMESYAKAYPNPTTGDISIVLSQKINSPVKISIYNLIGEKISEVLENSPAGISEYHVSLSGMPSGMYFIKTETIDVSATQKINLIKEE